MNAITPFTLAGDATRASRSVKSTRPPVPSSTPISTLTPQTITSTDQGTARSIAASSPVRASTSTAAAAKAASPRLTFNTTTAITQIVPTASVIRCAPVNGCGASCSIRTSSRSSLGPPNNAHAITPTSACAVKFAAHTRHSWPPSPALPIAELTITPTALNGERFPAFAPLPIMSAVSSTGTPARTPANIASGARSASVAIAPGPMVLIPQASTKKRSGRNEERPAVRASERCVSAAMVPFDCATPKSNVTPSSVRKSDEGKAAIIASAFHPAA